MPGLYVNNIIYLYCVNNLLIRTSMTHPECSALQDEYFYLIGSEYLDRSSGGKCTLKNLAIIEDPLEKGNYMVMCEFSNRMTDFIGSKILIRLDLFLNSDRFQRIRMASL